MSDPSATQITHPYRKKTTGSRSEKAAARKVFDAALKRKLHEVMPEAKQVANRISGSPGLRDLETLPDPTS